MSKELTEKQRQVLDFITKYKIANNIVPKYDHIKQNFNFKSIRSVQQYIKALITKGYLKPKPFTTAYDITKKSVEST